MDRTCCCTETKNIIRRHYIQLLNFVNIKNKTTRDRTTQGLSEYLELVPHTILIHRIVRSRVILFLIFKKMIGYTIYNIDFDCTYLAKMSNFHKSLNCWYLCVFLCEVCMHIVTSFLNKKILSKVYSTNKLVFPYAKTNT